MVATWENANTQTAIQLGGAGNQLLITDPETVFDTLSGGGYSYESDFSDNRPEGYIGTRKTSNPERVTGTIRSRLYTQVIQTLEAAAADGCLFNAYVLEGCNVRDRLDLAGFAKGYVVIGAGSTSGQGVTDNPLSDRSSGANPKMMLSLGLSAAFARVLLPVALVDITGEVTTGAITKVIPLGGAQCQGICGIYDDGNQKFIAVTEARGGSYTYPQLLYTSDAGKTWVVNNLTGIAAGDATGVTVAGELVIVSATGTNGGIYTASLDDVKAGTAVGLLATGSTNGDTVNAVRAITQLNVIACGAAGAIWESVNGGYSWELVGAGTTAEALVDIAGESKSLIWIAGENGALVKYTNLVSFSLVVVDASLAAVDLNAIDVPKFQARGNELYIGCSNGEVWRTLDAGESFSEMSVPPVASSSITDLRFGGITGISLWIVQTDASPHSRILRDLSGGNIANNAVAISQFTAPTNNGLNSIAPSDQNNALTGGEVVSTYAFIGKVG